MGKLLMIIILPCFVYYWKSKIIHQSCRSKSYHLLLPTLHERISLDPWSFKIAFLVMPLVSQFNFKQKIIGSIPVYCCYITIMHRTMKVLLASAAFNIFWMPLTAHGNLLRANREEKSAANESTQSRKVRSFFDFVDFVNYVLRNALARPFDFLIWYSLDLFASQLLWNFVPTSKEVNNNNSYDNYDDKEVPSDTSINDPVDFLRSTDVCYKNGSYSLSNCPTPPNCNFSGKFGAAKLCINRVPRPGDFQYYVMVMKCIPQWENWYVELFLSYVF